MAHLEVLKPEACQHLLDVLEMLPLDVLENNLWHVLIRKCTGSALGEHAPKDDGPSGNFKLACRQSRALADLLTSTITRDLSRLKAQPTSASAAATADWQQRSTFFSRLPRLHCLSLQSWPSYADLTTTLNQHGFATLFRLKQLTLSGGQLSETCMWGVRQAFPALRELSLTVTGNNLTAAGPLFRPLHGAEHLSKIVSSVTNQLADDRSNEYLSSLAGLSRLQHLHLTLDPCDLSDLTHLTGLRGLRHFSASLSGEGFCSLFDLGAVFAAATQLTTLSLSNLVLVNDDDPVVVTSVCDMSLLGALRSLRSLDLGRYFDIDKREWASVSQLSLLTFLGYGQMTARGLLPGGLPLLQSLRVGWNTTEVHPEADCGSKPSQLLLALLPLLPLPSLVELRGTVVNVSLCFTVSHRGEADAAEQSAALLSVCKHLAAAPRLRLGTQMCVCGKAGVGGLPLAHVSAGLHLLRERPTELEVDDMDLTGVQWVIVQQALPSLHELILCECQLPCGEVAALVQGFTTLVHLIIDRCSGNDGEDEGATWAEAAAVCLRPLQVRVRPMLPAGVMAECQAVQERLFGRQFITWE